MADMPRHETASDAELIEYCSRPDREIIGGMFGGNRVVKISDEAVVKFGGGVKEEEAKNLEMARILLDPEIVRVPRLHRFFTHKGIGYIVMEYMDGRIVEAFEYPGLARRVGTVLNHLHQIRGRMPGPLQSGISRGILWDSDKPTFKTTQAMEDWLNRRILADGPKLALGNCELVLCHLDIAPQNILRLQDDSVCFLDWASAGFYPKFFETAVLKIMAGRNGNFNELVIRNMGRLKDGEEAQVRLVMEAWGNSERFYL